MPRYNLKENLRCIADKVNTLLNELIINEHQDDQLVNAMRYASIGGGKKIRAFLVLKVAELFGVNEVAALYAAAAIEMVHSYSLIHDDLPCMDNSDFRRGKPSCHKKYGEAIALLAGNSLQNMAFLLLTKPEVSNNYVINVKLIIALASSIGSSGMLGGQALDIINSNQNVTFNQILKLYQMKTGALFTVACEFGGILGYASEEKMQYLREYAKNIGLAFQIRDDLLDLKGNDVCMGKAINQDAKLGKYTSVNALGLEGAELYLSSLVQNAINSLKIFDQLALPLVQLANFIIGRDS